ncbi:glycosyltransferase family 9 protein [candidate division KSB1 bacterium]|nr:glycosyltransferase family 9 protein [candidate division KSB1 bacterium]
MISRKTNWPLRSVLVIRTDRLGDVILSLPVLTALKNSFPGVTVTMLVRSYTAAVVADYPDVDLVLLSDENGSRRGFRQLWHLVQKLRRYRFEAVLVLHPTLELALICFLARIPIRVGTGFRAYSFLFNRQVFHHRKTAARHELEYNLELAAAIGAHVGPVEFKIQVPPAARQIANDFVTRLEIKPGQKLVILHPGSGGSARDWPLASFAALNDRLVTECQARTVVTAGPEETALVQRLLALTQHPPAVWAGTNGLKPLAALLQHAALFISNSTGPLHLAVAMATPVIGFFCPILACLPQRWGPYDRADSVLMPPVPVCKKCTLESCQWHDCMALISVEEALSLAKSKL